MFSEHKRIIVAFLMTVVLSGGLLAIIKTDYKDLTSAQLETISKATKGDKTALNMLLHDGSNGKVYAQLALANMAEINAEQNKSVALSWYQMAAKTGDFYAMIKTWQSIIIVVVVIILFLSSLFVALKFIEVFTRKPPEPVTNPIRPEHIEHEQPLQQPRFLKYKIAECFYVWGKIYEQGKFVKKDLKTALNYLEKAAEYGHLQAAEAAKQIDCRLDIVSTIATLPSEPQQLNKSAGEAKKVSLLLPLRKPEFPDIKYISLKSFREWLSLADSNNVEAQCVMGIMYDDGIQISVSYDSAVHWYRKAEQRNSAEAQYRFGCMYYDGRGVNKSKKAAMAYFKQAAEQGHKKAQRRLALNA